MYEAISASLGQYSEVNNLQEWTPAIVVLPMERLTEP